MSSASNDAFSDVINLIAAPIASALRAADQVRRGLDELIRSIENMNRTMENLNEAATRVNNLLADIEGPVRAMVPQVTRTVEAAEAITCMLESPVRKAAPNIEKVVDTLSSPAFTGLPAQLGEVMTMIGDVSKRLAPLADLAQNAGGMFGLGGLRLPGMIGKPVEPIPAPTERPQKSAAKKAAPRKRD